MKEILITGIYLATAVYVYKTAYYPAIKEYIFRCLDSYGASANTDRLLHFIIIYRKHIGVILSLVWPLLAVVWIAVAASKHKPYNNH